MRMISVTSSAIAAIGYESGTLGVQFHTSRKVYTFPSVPYGVFTDFLNAASKGDFYHQNVRGRYS